MPAPTGPTDDFPTGTVTFLFSDVQNSTRLWEEHPEPMRLALARHDALLAGLIGGAGGHVFKTAGDAFFAAFDRPEAAVGAALAVQKALHREPWGLPGGLPLRVRLALHTGAAELRGGDYFGGALSRAARLLGAAHGGQTLVSEATALLVGTAGLPSGATLRSLGRHGLKDLGQPQEIHHLVHPDLPSDFPPPRSLQAFTHNLPGQMTSFVGREAEMDQARERLRSSRLLTLTGTGGSGKSRLAVQVAADALDDYADGAWLVELAPLSDPDLVSQAVAGVLGLGEEPDRRLMQTLTDALRPKSLLLILDNCEHLIDACARLAEDLLRACPGLRILATSREGLDIPGEAVLPLSSLGLPPPLGLGLALPSADALLAGSASIRLFVDRATAAQPQFRFSDGNAQAVSQVCTRLDGIPLALELAAARVKVLSPEQIMGRLDDRFRLLTGGSRTALPRLQTLRALIDWSYDLLPPAERAVFRRLSVFSGGWTLDAVEAVCAGEEIEAWEILDLLSHLVAKSLVIAEPPEAGQVRYRMLENLRQYGRERLDAAGEGQTLTRRHAAWFLTFAEEAEAHLSGPEHARRLDQLERDHDNLRLALTTSRDTPEQSESFLRLAGALHRFWSVRSFLSEGRGWLEAALAGAPDAPPAVRAKALNGVGVLAWSCGDVAEARAFHEEDLSLRRALNDRRGSARALANLGILAAEQGDFGEAGRLFEESLAVYRDLGDRENVAFMLNNLGTMRLDSRDVETALPYLEESLGMFRLSGDGRGVCVALNNLGVARRHQGRYAEARRFFCESLLGQQVLGDKQRIASTLSNAAYVLALLDDPETAAVLLAAAENVLRAAGVPSLADEREDHEATRTLVRERLGPDEFSRRWEQGGGLSAAQAIVLILDKYGPLTE